MAVFLRQKAGLKDQDARTKTISRGFWLSILSLGSLLWFYDQSDALALALVWGLWTLNFAYSVAIQEWWVLEVSGRAIHRAPNDSSKKQKLQVTASMLRIVIVQALTRGAFALADAQRSVQPRLGCALRLHHLQRGRPRLTAT